MICVSTAYKCYSQLIDIGPYLSLSGAMEPETQATTGPVDMTGCQPPGTPGRGDAALSPVQPAMDQLDVATFQWVRRVQRGEFGRRIIGQLGLDLELAQFQGLTAIARMQCGWNGTRRSHPSVGELADELAIDPSRASRIAADLVTKGYVRRVASQSDGRQSFLELSPGGALVMQVVGQHKAAAMAHTYAGWSEADIIAFSRLFTRFAESGFSAPAEAGQMQVQRTRVTEALAAELDQRRD